MVCWWLKYVQNVMALKVYHWVSRVSLPRLSEVKIGGKKSFTHLIYFLVFITLGSGIAASDEILPLSS